MKIMDLEGSVKGGKDLVDLSEVMQLLDILLVKLGHSCNSRRVSKLPI